MVRLVTQDSRRRASWVRFKNACSRRLYDHERFISLLVTFLNFSGYLFDGEYHYYHHAHLTVNYAELEILDKLFGTHHSQDARFVAKKAA